MWLVSTHTHKTQLGRMLMSMCIKMATLQLPQAYCFVLLKE